MLFDDKNSIIRKEKITILEIFSIAFILLFVAIDVFIENHECDGQSLLTRLRKGGCALYGGNCCDDDSQASLRCWGNETPLT